MNNFVMKFYNYGDCCELERLKLDFYFSLGFFDDLEGEFGRILYTKMFLLSKYEICKQLLEIICKLGGRSWISESEF